MGKDEATDSGSNPKDAKDFGRPAEADAEQNRAEAEDEKKRRAREEFNIHEADMGRNPQG